MSDFKEKLNMFKASETPPPMKPKPAWPKSNLSTKVIRNPRSQNECVSIINEQKKFSQEMLTENKIDEIIHEMSFVNQSAKVDDIEETVCISEPIEIRENELELISCTAPIDDSTDVTYNLKNSIYDLPGLEKFTFESRPISNVGFVQEVYCNDVEYDFERQDDNGTIELAPSTYIIEEIVKTGTWRASACLNEELTSNSTGSNVDLCSQISNSNSTVPETEKPNLTLHCKKGIFSGLFTRTPKKSTVKSAVKDCSDSDSVHEMTDQKRTNSRNNVNDDNSSLDHYSKKPLSSLFNGDWLNSIGDGIKKKAVVLSELTNAFRNGKFNFNKKSPKARIDNNTKICKKNMSSKERSNTDKYDDDPTEISANKIKKLKSMNQKIVKNINIKKDCKNFAKNESDSDSVYDTEGNDDTDVDIHQVETKGILDSKDPIGVQEKKVNEVIFIDDNLKKESICDDDIYDNPEDYEDFNLSVNYESVQKDNKVEKGVNVMKHKENKIGHHFWSKKKSKGIDFYYDDDVTEDISKESKVDNFGIIGKKQVQPLTNNKSSKEQISKNKEKKTKTKITKDVETYDEDPILVEEYVDDREEIEEIKHQTKKELKKIEKQNKNALSKSKGTSNANMTTKMFEKDNETYDVDPDDDINVVGLCQEGKGPVNEICKNEFQKCKPDIKQNVNFQMELSNLICKKGSNYPIELKTDFNDGCEQFENEIKLDDDKTKNYLDLSEVYSDNDLLEDYDEENDSIYDVEEVDSIYDNEEEDVPIEMDTGKKCNKAEFKVPEKKNKTKMEILEIYEAEDEDDTMEGNADEEFTDTRKTTKIPKKQCHSSKENQMKPKSSITTKIFQDINRRKRNIITNTQNFIQIKSVPQNEQNNKKNKNKCEIVADVDESEDEALEKLKAANLKLAIKTFKLTEPIRTVGVARALKTIYLENKTYMTFNIGEILDILEYRDDVLLVRNAIGKCGLASKKNVQIIKSAP